MLILGIIIVVSVAKLSNWIQAGHTAGRKNPYPRGIWWSGIL